ncbi:ABC transporter substrate-binding protein [Anabaena sp. PCC 7108]|uniref:ABC transporter substrate-binding protein n=1 Tax=Anabaena sp. PCC 7108 TaxID=163908 RepID=UPI00130E6894|nr:ABC transporter substrate-binding protein [Anabaena sp. PCC 7108]
MKLIKCRNLPTKFLLILTIFFTVFYLIIGCQPQSNNRVYHIGLGPWIGFGPLYLAQEKGFFKDAGIQTELTVITGLAERNSALKSGKIDALAAPVDYFVSAAGNRLDTEIVMAIDESVGGDGIVAKKSIKSFQDLSGKKVAFQRGLPSEFFVRALLQKNGMSLTDLKEIDMETALAGAAFIKGDVDAAVVWEPWLTRATEKGKGYVLASTKEHPNLIVDCLAFNQKVVDQSPEDVQKIVNAVLKAIAYWEKNPQEANKIMAPFFQVDAAKYATILSGAKFNNLARNRQYFGTNENPGPIFAVAKQASDIWLKAGVIEDAVNPKSIISTKFVDGASEFQANVPSSVPIPSKPQQGIDWKEIVKIISNITEIAGVFPAVTIFISSAIGVGIYNIRRKINPSSKTFKFQGQEFSVITTEGLINREEKLQRSPSIDSILVCSQKPLEASYNFAKIVHSKIDQRFSYEYYFYCGEITNQTIDDISSLLQTLSVAKYFLAKKEQELYDKTVNWVEKTPDERKRYIRDNIDIVTSNLHKVQRNITIYLLLGSPEETFCIHQAQNTSICYLRWDDSNIFIKLPKVEANRKRNTLISKVNAINTQNVGIFRIDPHLNIKPDQLLDRIKTRFPDEITRTEEFKNICPAPTS